jgi:hypothetical protein
MKKFMTIACITLILMPALLTAAVDVTGLWKMTSQSPRGERTSDITFKQEGEKLTVTSKNMRGEDMTATGTVKGNAIEWTQKMSTPRGDFEIIYKGTIDGDSMKGTSQFGDRGTMEWTAVRAK